MQILISLLLDLFLPNKFGKKMLIKNKLRKMLFYKSLFLLLFINFYFCNNKAYANSTQIIKNVICKESSVIKNYLENNQNEKLAWLGVAQDGSTITELYISKTTNTWTILETDTKGMSCATIGGKDSRVIE